MGKSKGTDIWGKEIEGKKVNEEEGKMISKNSQKPRKGERGSDGGKEEEKERWREEGVGKGGQREICASQAIFNLGIYRGRLYLLSWALSHFADETEDIWKCPLAHLG